ncbi:hypothetical protein MTR67_039069 [Solanum verrucosum]|uniref:ABC transmembrane type-1 domain-containing protein n=1 Tax=Solanum verrucosum TaxID=315347 RepID=A0AAF0UGZ4_SOLVR|nr:hypothetical protein MTR67_039069 [Solanum verrucosum]
MLLNSFRLLSKLEIFRADETPLEVPPKQIIKLGAQLDNFIHYMATFLSGFVVEFTPVWQVALVAIVTPVVVPLIVVIGAIYTMTSVKLSRKSKEALS